MTCLKRYIGQKFIKLIQNSKLFDKYSVYILWNYGDLRGEIRTISTQTLKSGNLDLSKILLSLIYDSDTKIDNFIEKYNVI